MIEETGSEAASVRRSLRPALIVSGRNLTEHTTILRRLLVGMANESIPVALVCPPNFDTDMLTPAPAALFTHPLFNLPFMERVGVDWLAGQLEKFRPTILHCLCESRATLTRQLARRLGIPYVLTINSLSPSIRRLSVSHSRCARIIAPAESIRAHVIKSLPRFADRVAQINMGSFVDTEMMCFSNPSRLPSIVAAHPLRRTSDFDPFFRAIKSLRTDSREFMAVVMGAGPAEHSLRRLLVTLGLSDIVTIVPILNPWRSVVAAGDIFVQAQPLREFSAFLLEAMAVGTAVAACWGGVDDLIIPNQTALTFEPGSEPSIRQTLKQLLDDRDCARRLAATAQEHIRARYSVSAMVAAILKVYLEAQQIQSPFYV
ncbi:MAG: glycosyltransferase family 4 protein [Solirubrobacterales bacterium]